MDKQKISTEVYKILYKYSDVPVENLHSETTLDSLEMNEFETASVSMEIEDLISAELSMEDMEQIKTVRELVDLAYERSLIPVTQPKEVTAVGEQGALYPEGNKDGYVEVCSHILNKTRPILHVMMDVPYDSEHTGLVCDCNVEPCDDDRSGDILRMPIADMLEYEPSLKPFVKDPAGEEYEFGDLFREDVDSPWELS